jgi:hypothetical protein
VGDRSSGEVPAAAPRPAEPQRTMLYRRVLGGDYGLAQVWFDRHVLDRYREQRGYRIIRTNTAGRLIAPAGWTLDFGIADNDRLIHAAVADLAQRLPPAERQHWLNYLVTPPFSRNFFAMRGGSGSCFDDGEVRDWVF